MDFGSFDVNRPSMLSALLEQALPKFELIDEEDRIRIGSEGGLGWRLFQHELAGDNQFPRQAHILSLGDFGRVESYIANVRSYIERARQHALKSRFNLVKFDGEPGKIVPFPIDDPMYSYVYSIHLGGDILTLSRFEEFLEMVKSGRGELQEQYEALYKEAEGFDGVKRRK